MNWLQIAGQNICHAVSVITDWLLIGSGAVLILTALFRVNVPLAQGGLLACGFLFSSSGCWFRSRRLRRSR